MNTQLKCPCEDMFVNNDQWIAIAIAGNEQRHVGILYKQDDQGPMFCHLAWHYYLKNEQPNRQYCWSSSGLDEYNQKAVASAFACIAEKNSKGIPYSPVIDLNGLYFDKAWNFIRSDLGEGLTCASFLMVVYKQLSFDLFDYGSWEVREDDKEWQLSIVNHLKCSYPQHASAVIKQLESSKFRFRPEEVAAAVADENIPLSFMEAKTKGEQLVVEMKNLGCLSA